MGWGVVVNMFDSNIKVGKYELQTRYNIPFRTNTLGKGINPLIQPAKDLNSTIAVLTHES